MCSETPEKTFHSLRGMGKAQTLIRVTLPSTCKCTCHRVHPFNPRLPRFIYPEMEIYSVGPLLHIKVCVLQLARKGCVQNNLCALKMRCSTDVFDIFSLSQSCIIYIQAELQNSRPVLSTLQGRMKANDNTHPSYGRSRHPSSVQAWDSP